MKRTLVVLTFVLVGCATEPVPTSEARQVPRARIISPLLLAPGSGKESVIVKRDQGIMGAGCTSRLYVDGAPVADIETSEKVELFLSLGEHMLGAKPQGICSGNGAAESSVNVVQGRRKTFRISYGQGGDNIIQPTAF